MCETDVPINIHRHIYNKTQKRLYREFVCWRNFIAPKRAAVLNKRACFNQQTVDTMIAIARLCILLLCSSQALCFDTGFWYGGSRPPITKYDTVPYANLTVRVNRPFTDGPGQDLVKDPFDPDISLYVGPSINRQTFDTQFILDMNYAIGIDPSRVYVLYVAKGTVHFSWESNYVIVNFIFLERNGTTGATLLESIEALTKQIQTPTSRLYTGTNVTSEIDDQWGLEVVSWDISLKLTYAIDIVGKDAVKDGYYLNQGSLGICDQAGGYNVSYYCEFERFFEDDVSRALNISYYRVQVLFIKASALDSVLVHFRVTPPKRVEMIGNFTTIPEIDVHTAIGLLQNQTADPDSLLYKGNVTIRTGECPFLFCFFSGMSGFYCQAL